MSPAEPAPAWIAAQKAGSARALRQATSATDLTRHREGFGWTVRPAPGSILASTRVAGWDPEPDYFHHWVRDAAIALRAAPLAIVVDPGSREFWLQAISDYINFSLRISNPKRHGPASNPLRETVQNSFRKFLRPDAELATLRGEHWLEEPRVAADGAPDLEQWGRPQDDGPALRASSLMAVLEALPEAASPEAEALIARDLAHTAAIAGRPCIGPWEEWPPRRTTFTLIAQWDALDRGCSRAGVRGLRAEALRVAADKVAVLITDAADDTTGGWRESIEARAGTLDSAAVLALLHANRATGPFALGAPRTGATVAALEKTFAAHYPINGGRAVPAIGRWVEDVYFGGNPWVPTTLGFAELHYRLAVQSGDPVSFGKAEAWMALVQDIVPDAPGPLPEQFDRVTGRPTSCLNLTWSAAAFLEAAAARDLAVQALAGSR